MHSYIPSAVDEEFSAWLGREPENTEHDFLLLRPIEIHRLKKLFRQLVKPVQNLFHFFATVRIDEEVEDRNRLVPEVCLF
jgi:hypothetical protein